jgi:hypothetical protein
MNIASAFSSPTNAFDTAADDELSKGFDAGNYDAAYTSTTYDAERVPAEASALFRAAYVLGFFSSCEASELGDDADTYNDALASRAGQRCVELGYVDVGSEAEG